MRRDVGMGLLLCSLYALSDNVISASPYILEMVR